MPSQRHDEPTSGGRLFVGSPREERVLAEVVHPLLRQWLSQEPDLGGTSPEGNISSWIYNLFNRDVEIAGLRLSGSSSQLAQLLAEPVDYVARELVQRGQNAVKVTHPILSLRDLDFDEAEWTSIENKSGIKKFDASRFLTLLRALRVVAICLFQYKIHPLGLVKEASQGNKHAILQLVRLDTLFLTDPCTHGQIRKASLENDKRFRSQLARAQKGKPQIAKNTVPRLILFALLALPIPLPKYTRLWLLLDPNGEIFNTPEAFERFVQRGKKEFERLCSIV